MNLSEFCKLKRDNAHLSEEEFALLVYRQQKESVRAAIIEEDRERLEQQISKEIDNKLEKVIDKAFVTGNNSIKIAFNL